MEKWYIQGKSKKVSKTFSLKKYWRKPNASELVDKVADFKRKM